MDQRRPRSAQTQTVAVNIGEAPTQNGSRRFQLEVSECVETKTVTTTTRLTRKFPQVFVRDPTPLSNLDAKEYPLAMKPAPPELSNFSYTLGKLTQDEPDADEPQTNDTVTVKLVRPTIICRFGGKGVSCGPNRFHITTVINFCANSRFRRTRRHIHNSSTTRLLRNTRRRHLAALAAKRHYHRAKPKTAELALIDQHSTTQ